jgi:hypothetical protein
VCKMTYLKFTFIFMFLTSLGCFCHDLEGIEFLTKKAESFNVTVNPGFDFSLGFAICLRVMFYLLNPSIILNCPGTFTVELREYLPGRGVVQVLIMARPGKAKIGYIGSGSVWIELAR